jgi:hypothetical protein
LIRIKAIENRSFLIIFICILVIIISLSAGAFAVTTGGSEWNASWIWGKEKKHGSIGYFRKIFYVDGKVKMAFLQMTGDDCFTLFVNKKMVKEGCFSWKSAHMINVLPYIRQGKNIVAAEVRNVAYPGGFLLQGDIYLIDGREININTDQTWKFSKKNSKGWLDARFDDQTWENCKEFGGPPVSPWGKLPVKYPGPRPLVEIVNLDVPTTVDADRDIQLSISVVPRGKIPFDVRAFVRIMRDNHILVSSEIEPHIPSSSWNIGEKITLPKFTVHIPKYSYSGDYEVEVGLYRTRCSVASTYLNAGTITIKREKTRGKLPVTKIVNHNGSPTLFINNNPVPPMWFFQSPPIKHSLHEFHSAGIDIVTAAMPLGWTRDGSDFSAFDQSINEILASNESAFIVPRINLSAPGWWVEAHEKELTRYARNVGWVNNVWGGTKHNSFASMLWRKEASDALRRLIRHVINAPYSDRVAGYHISSGIYGEWHYWSATDLPDTSESMRQVFIKHIKKMYDGDIRKLRKAWNDPMVTFKTITVPGEKERYSGDVGVFRDPGRSRKVRDYYYAFHQNTADVIEEFGRVVKEETDGKSFVIVFYGYTPDMNWPVEGDHRALNRIIDSHRIDCFSSPHSYSRRKSGEDAYPRHFMASVRLHGKCFIDEADDRTHLARDPQYTHVETLNDSLQVLRREFMYALTNQAGLWFMDQQGFWYSDQAIMNEIKLMKHWLDRSIGEKRKSVAEIAVFYSLDSAFNMINQPSSENLVGAAAYNETVGQLTRMGAPFDMYLIDDLLSNRLPSYKIYIFPDAYYLNNAQREAIEKLKTDKNTLIFMYAPGFVSDEHLSITAMSGLIGINMKMNKEGAPFRILERRNNTGTFTYGNDRIQAPTFFADDEKAEIIGINPRTGKGTLVRKGFGNWTSVYSLVPEIPWQVLGHIIENAGVHRYQDSGDILQANNLYIGFHSSSDGQKTLLLPKSVPVFDIFAGQQLAESTNTISIDLASGQTRIYYLGERSPE